MIIQNKIKHLTLKTKLSFLKMHVKLPGKWEKYLTLTATAVLTLVQTQGNPNPFNVESWDYTLYQLLSFRLYIY